MIVAGYEINHLIFFFSSIVAALFYSYFLSSKLPKGILRLLSLAPVFLLFALLPLTLSAAFPTAVATFYITWLASFKLLLFAFDRPPLSPPKSLILFVAVAALPVKIQSKPNPIKPKKIWPLKLWIEALISPILLSFAYEQREILHPQVILVVYCCLVFLMIDLLVVVSSAVTRAAVGVELEPPSDEPYLATSLQDFWGRRWNLMVANLLRHTVYVPVRSAFSGKDWAPLTAVLATFVVSGLMHELLFYYVTRVSPTWEMTLFFVLHGVCVVGELMVKRAAAGRWGLPAMVSRPLTVGFVVATSFWLFFPPLTRSGADVRVLEEFKLCFDYVKSVIV